MRNLFADVELLNDLAISINVFLHQIVQQAASFSNELKEAQPAVVVFLVTLKMWRERVQMRRKDGNLDFGRAGVGLGFSVFLDEFGLLFFGNRHCDSFKMY